MITAMLNFRDIALFLLGAAVVIDTALLLVLAEGRNRRRVATALLSLLCGSLMFHLGFLGSLYDRQVIQHSDRSKTARSLDSKR